MNIADTPKGSTETTLDAGSPILMEFLYEGPLHFSELHFARLNEPLLPVTKINILTILLNLTAYVVQYESK